MMLKIHTIASTLALFIAASLSLPTQIASAQKTKGSKAKAGKRGGDIIGVIKFKGKAPQPKKIDNSSDSFCAQTELFSDEVLVKKARLQDVHVRIKSGSMGKHSAPVQPVVVAQVGCQYKPHVIGAMVGQPVAISNGDKTMHNVHARINKETWFNRSQPAGAPKIVETDTGKPGEVFSLICNVHPWMSSFLPITDHPYFDVSDSKGLFKIKNVPAGKYTLEAWHPKYGLKSTTIQVSAKTPKVTFQFP